jgi:mannose-6-phosphate isomerase-like protein (cupin superfamily)
MYFSIPGPFSIEGGKGLLLFPGASYRGFFQIGGPVEPRGRLRYIDGCTDSLLIPPIRLGDPCLNLLHIPPETQQSVHTHPSFRLGMIVEGSGHCVSGAGEQPLKCGDVFYIPKDCLHSFRTASDDLLVLAFHPDSDTGPTDEDHPMRNRTVLAR